MVSIRIGRASAFSFEVMEKQPEGVIALQKYGIMEIDCNLR